jgi:hypothetical protein
MIFDTLLTSDFVKWNKEVIERNGMRLECAQMWEQEPLNCILQVVNISYVNYENKITLDCTQDCGCHLFYEMGRAEYEEYSKVIGEEMLIYADSFAEVADSFISEEEKGYDFEEDFLQILGRIALDRLPANKRRT